MKKRADEFRNKVSKTLKGKGLELGPGQIIFPAPNASEVVYVDKLPSNLHKDLFPELGANVQIIEPDHLIDFDKDRLKFFDSESFDFVIASHLLEHLAQPFRMLDEIYRVLKVGGLAIIFLPDRRRTFDKNRNCPDIKHFIEEYENGNHDVDISDLKDYLLRVEGAEWTSLEDPFVKRHLERSIHVHAWTDFEFIKLLADISPYTDYNFALFDAIASNNDESLEEFGLVLRKLDLSERNKGNNFLNDWNIITSNNRSILRRILLYLTNRFGES